MTEQEQTPADLAVRRVAQACLSTQVLRQVMAGVLEQRMRAVGEADAAGLGPRELTRRVEALLELWGSPDAAVSYETVKGDLRASRVS